MLGLLKTPNSNLERIALRGGVPNDEEFKRIDSLPRRKWSAEQTLRAVQRLTARLRRKRGTRVLWDDQAIALSEIGWYGGIVGGLRVSGGKTTTSFLAGTMLPDCPRPLLIAPSKSIKTGKVARAYDNEQKHWRVRDDYSWVSYHFLQDEDNAEYLSIHLPGLLILDEAHHAGRYNSSRTKRIRRYLDEHPEVPCIVLTGSLIASRVVNDSLALCDWARGRHSPLPLPAAKDTQRYWKLALDVPKRLEPGALRRWCEPNEPTVAGVGRRYYETPGIVCSAGKNVIGTTLLASTELVSITDTRVLDAFSHVRAGRRPDGTELLDPDGSNTWSLAQQLALGFYYEPTVPPPDDWTDAYRNWCSYCREHIADSSCKCDTARQVIRHVTSDATDCWPLEEWLLVKSQYKLERKAVWLSSSRVDAALRWTRRHRHALVWTQFKAFGFALAAKGLPYYGSHARDRATKRYITDHKPGAPASASIAVCSEDLDLQYTFCESLFVAPPATGAWHEQAIARYHRFGQPEPEVMAHYWIACAENRDALSVARQRERSAAAMTGDFSRKMLIAEWSPNTRKKLKSVGPQWDSKKLTKALMK